MLNQQILIDRVKQNIVTCLYTDMCEKLISNITFWVKYWGFFLVRLKTIKYKKDILSYLSSYTSFIFLAQYFISFIEYWLVLDLLVQLSWPNSFNISKIWLNYWVIELSRDYVKSYWIKDQYENFTH